MNGDVNNLVPFFLLSVVMLNIFGLGWHIFSTRLTCNLALLRSFGIILAQNSSLLIPTVFDAELYGDFVSYFEG